MPATLCWALINALGPPMSVLTQPGCSSATLTPRGSRFLCQAFGHHVQRRLAGTVEITATAGVVVQTAHFAGDQRYGLALPEFQIGYKRLGHFQRGNSVDFKSTAIIHGLV